VKQPVEIDIFSNLVTGAAMLGAVALASFQIFCPGHLL